MVSTSSFDDWGSRRIRSIFSCRMTLSDSRAKTHLSDSVRRDVFRYFSPKESSSSRHICVSACWDLDEIKIPSWTRSMKDHFSYRVEEEIEVRDGTRHGSVWTHSPDSHCFHRQYCSKLVEHFYLQGKDTNIQITSPRETFHSHLINDRPLLFRVGVPSREIQVQIVPVSPWSYWVWLEEILVIIHIRYHRYSEFYWEYFLT